MPRCCAAARCSCNSKELNFHVIIPSLEMNNGLYNEAAVCEVKRNNIGASLKHFEPNCFKTERVYAFDIP